MHHTCGAALARAAVSSSFDPTQPPALVLSAAVGATLPFGFFVCVCLVVLINNSFLKYDVLYNKRFNKYCLKCILQMFIYQYWQFNMLVLTFIHLKLGQLCRKMAIKYSILHAIMRATIFTQKGENPKGTSSCMKLWIIDSCVFNIFCFCVFQIFHDGYALLFWRQAGQVH